MTEQNPGGDGRRLVDVRLLAPEEWQVARAARLAALGDAPGSFLPTWPPESSWTEARWRESCTSSRWAVARAGEGILGLARLTRADIGPHVESVWTHPDHRRRGIASALIRTLVDEEWEHGASEVFVWVIEPNPAAYRLYTSLGFEPTHERQLLDGLGRVEQRVRLSGRRGRD